MIISGRSWPTCYGIRIELRLALRRPWGFAAEVAEPEDFCLEVRWDQRYYEGPASNPKRWHFRDVDRFLAPTLLPSHYCPPAPGGGPRITRPEGYRGTFR